MKELCRKIGIAMLCVFGVLFFLTIFLTPVIGVLCIIMFSMPILEEVGWDGPEGVVPVVVVCALQIYLSNLAVSHLH